MSRNKMIDVIKGISILMVIADHFDMVIPTQSVYLQAIEHSFFMTYMVGQAVPFFVLISGYLLAESFEKNKIVSIDEAYQGTFMMKRCLRLYIPWIPVWLLFCFENMAGRGGMGAAFRKCLDIFFRGIEPGGYYIVIVLQLYFIFPVVFHVVKKYFIKGCMFFFLLQLLYEISKDAFFMSERSYKYHIFGYVFLLAMGVYFALYGARIKKYVPVLMIVAGILGTQARMAGVPIITAIFNDTDKRTLFGNLYVGGVFYYLYQWKGRIRFYPLELAGRASYSIMIVQSFVFGVLHNQMSFFSETENVWFAVAQMTGISIFGGIVYYYVFEVWCTKKITGLLTGSKQSGLQTGKVLLRYGAAIMCLCILGQGIHKINSRNLLLDLDEGDSAFASDYIYAGQTVQEMIQTEEKMQVETLQIRTVTWHAEFPEDTLFTAALSQGEKIVATAVAPMRSVPDNGMLILKFEEPPVLEEGAFMITVTTNCPKDSTVAVMLTDRFSNQAHYSRIHGQVFRDRDLCIRIRGKVCKGGAI